MMAVLTDVLRRHWHAIGLVLVTALAGLLLLRQPAADCGPYCAAIIQAHTRQMAADAQALQVARASMRHDSIQVERTVYHYRDFRDTFQLTDTVQVKVFVARADSVVRACTELQSSCALFRVRAESVIAGLTQEHDALAASVAASRPSRVGRAWASVRLPLAFVAGAWVGSRVVR